MSQDGRHTPPELREIAENNLNNLLPKKSSKVYQKEYADFQLWCEQNNVQDISENVLIAFFHKESQIKKASSMWSKYSMLRSCLNIYRNIDISKYKKLQAYLKRLSEGYTPKKSKILDVEQINRFIGQADDKTYLAIKVILIMGYNGACRREEITNMSVDGIEIRDDVLIVPVPKTKNYITRQFIITNSDWIQMVTRYFSLRPKHVTSRRFFLTYRNGYCINTPNGLNTIGKGPFVIASYLQLPNPKLFTGHCFRRSSVTHLANSGGDLNTIKKHGGWKSSAVAEGYIETSMKSKVGVANILSTVQTLHDVPPSCLSSISQNTTATASVTSSETTRLVLNEQGLTQNIVSTQNIPGITINATEHSTVTINIYNNHLPLPKPVSLEKDN